MPVFGKKRMNFITILDHIGRIALLWIPEASVHVRHEDLSPTEAWGQAQ